MVFLALGCVQGLKVGEMKVELLLHLVHEEGQTLQGHFQKFDQIEFDLSIENTS
jgi:hypothetical protein